MPETAPYNIPPSDWANGMENEDFDATLHFSINDGATVIEAYGLCSEYGIVSVGGYCDEIAFSPNLPSGGLTGVTRRTYAYSG